MTTSNSYDFSISRDDIIRDAYQEIGVLEEGETPNAQQTTDAARKLNMFVKTIMQKGNHLWCVQDAVLFLVLGQQSYSLGSASTDAEWADPADLAMTTTTAAAAAGASTITVDSITGIASGDRIGVVLDSGDFQWTTVNGAPSGSTVTLTAVLTGAAALGNTVYAYTNRLVRPMRLIENTIYLRQQTGTQANDFPVNLIGSNEYQQLTSKMQRGLAISVAYQPYLTSGKLWTWPTCDLVTRTLRFSYERPIQDFDLATDNPDFPIEASVMLYKNLAALLAPSQGAIEELSWLKPEAKEALEDWLDFDRDNASVSFQPDLRTSRTGSASRRW